MAVNTTTLATNITIYGWGLDLSGSLQGAGGVGGLLSVTTVRPNQPNSLNTLFPCYDVNGNITEYVSDYGIIAAHREYSMFGETAALTRSVADFDSITLWWSTKPWCPVTCLSEYKYRKYRPEMGRWLNRDPLGDELFFLEYTNGKNDKVRDSLRERTHSSTLLFVGNNPIDNVDPYGLTFAKNNWLFDWILEQAELRRGNGPWSDSAQHCWAACRIGLMSPLAGNAAALIADFAEWADGMNYDAWRDIAGQHAGAACAQAMFPLGALAPGTACDCCCLSR